MKKKEKKILIKCILAILGTAIAYSTMFALYFMR